MNRLCSNLFSILMWTAKETIPPLSPQTFSIYAAPAVNTYKQVATVWLWLCLILFHSPPINFIFHLKSQCAIKEPALLCLEKLCNTVPSLSWLQICRSKKRECMWVHAVCIPPCLFLDTFFSIKMPTWYQRILTAWLSVTLQCSSIPWSAAN